MFFVRAAAVRRSSPVQVIGPDKHGIKTIIEFKVMEDCTKARPAALARAGSRLSRCGRRR